MMTKKSATWCYFFVLKINLYTSTQTNKKHANRHHIEKVRAGATENNNPWKRNYLFNHVCDNQRIFEDMLSDSSVEIDPYEENISNS